MPRSALLSQAVPAAPGLYIPHVPVPSLIPLTPRGDSGPARSRSIPPPARRRQPGFIRHYLFLYTLIHTVPRVVSSSPSSVLCPCRVQSAVGGTHTLPRVPGPSPAVPCPLPIPVVSTWGGGGGAAEPIPPAGAGPCTFLLPQFPCGIGPGCGRGRGRGSPCTMGLGGPAPPPAPCSHPPTLQRPWPRMDGTPNPGRSSGILEGPLDAEATSGVLHHPDPCKGVMLAIGSGSPSPCSPPRNLSGGGGQWGGGLYLTCSAAWEEQ